MQRGLLQRCAVHKRLMSYATSDISSKSQRANISGKVNERRARVADARKRNLKLFNLCAVRPWDEYPNVYLAAVRFSSINYITRDTADVCLSRGNTAGPARPATSDAARLFHAY